MSYRIGLVNQRTYARLEVLRGAEFTVPSSLTHTAQVKDGQTILSGQLIVIDDAGGWRLADADTDGTGNKRIYIALQDSTDEDVIEAEGLTGYDVAGDFEFESAFFEPGGTYSYEGATPLTLSTTAGAIAPTTYAAGTAAKVIIGRISRPSPRTLGTGTATHQVDATAPAVSDTYYQPGENSNVMAGTTLPDGIPQKVITWGTAYQVIPGTA